MAELLVDRFDGDGDGDDDDDGTGLLFFHTCESTVCRSSFHLFHFSQPPNQINQLKEGLKSLCRY